MFHKMSPQGPNTYNKKETDGSVLAWWTAWSGSTGSASEAGEGGWQPQASRHQNKPHTQPETSKHDVVGKGEGAATLQHRQK